METREILGLAPSIWIADWREIGPTRLIESRPIRRRTKKSQVLSEAARVHKYTVRYGYEGPEWMRVRTEEKRRAIVDVAAELFETHGFDRTSMSMIAERLGGSKATLYGYFRSKEELLDAVLTYDVTEQADRLMNEFLSQKNVRDGLVKLGIAYMTRRLSATPIANVRNVATQPPGSTVGKEFYENVLRPAWKRLAARFKLMMDEGILRRADPWIAAMHWKGLNEWDMFEKRLLGAIDGPDAKEIERASRAAADAFLTLYGANGHEAAERKVPDQPLKRRSRASKDA